MLNTLNGTNTHGFEPSRANGSIRKKCWMLETQLHI